MCDSARPSALEGICALEREDDDPCPADMTCIEVDLLTKRCGHELD